MGDSIKVVIQDGEKNCGVACLLSIIRYYGGDVSQEILREYTNTSKDGVSALSLINCAKKIGFDATGVHGEIDDIDRSKLPVIAHTVINKNIKHFIVIYEMNDSKDKIIIMDPSIGKRIISFSELSLLSTRNFIYLTPNKKIPVYKYKKIVRDTIKQFIIHLHYGFFHCKKGTLLRQSALLNLWLNGLKIKAEFFFGLIQPGSSIAVCAGNISGSPFAF